MVSERDPVNAELELLRAFYSRWVAMHTIPRTLGHRKQQEAAAQTLVEAAHALRVFYQAGHAEEPKHEAPRLELVHG